MSLNHIKMSLYLSYGAIATVPFVTWTLICTTDLNIKAKLLKHLEKSIEYPSLQLGNK